MGCLFSPENGPATPPLENPIMIGVIPKEKMFIFQTDMPIIDQ
jgi:hypothetical protein